MNYLPATKDSYPTNLYLYAARAKRYGIFSFKFTANRNEWFVWAKGLEPSASWSQTKKSTQLIYTHIIRLKINWMVNIAITSNYCVHLSPSDQLKYMMINNWLDLNQRLTLFLKFIVCSDMSPIYCIEILIWSRDQLAWSVAIFFRID